MKVVLFDGYTDEPACLGVPPYISPYARLCYGALRSAGADVRYITVDQWRAGATPPIKGDLLAVIRNVAVPGKYLRGMPASDRELATLCSSFQGKKLASLGARLESLPDHLKASFDMVVSGDLDATLHDAASMGIVAERRRTVKEWNDWLEIGSAVVAEHPDIWGPLIAEVQMYRGCVRYISGGCRFCIEPLFGEVAFREKEDILREVRALARAGVRNYRLGAQSCVYCYGSREVGDSEVPKPNVEAVTSLLRAIDKAVSPEVFHLDNANPAVVAEHPDEALEITKAIAEHCTSGNVLAFGLESADPAVARANNLNSTPDQAMKAIELVNSVGSDTGPNGLPKVLPGINMLCGLDGETKDTYRMNLEFLSEVRDKGLLLRRINIRQVIHSRTVFPGIRLKEAFSRFKRDVRKEIDEPMLARVVPNRRVLRDVYTELREGGLTFGRQIGTYPLLVGIPYPLELNRRIDAVVTGRGSRSVGAILYPTEVNTAKLAMLEAVPGIGKRRAMAIVRRRPFTKEEDLWDLFDESEALGSARFHLSCEESTQK